MIGEDRAHRIAPGTDHERRLGHPQANQGERVLDRAHLADVRDIWL